MDSRYVTVVISFPTCAKKIILVGSRVDPDPVYDASEPIRCGQYLRNSTAALTTHLDKKLLI